MPPQYSSPYAIGYRQQHDGTVVFECSTNIAEFPWLALSPHHPAVIQTQNFWGSIGAIIELEGVEASKWTALTWTDWECGNPGVGHAVRGTYERTAIGDAPSFKMALYDAADRLIVTMRGRGVVFRNRNFEEWREGSKSEARKAENGGDFAFASRLQLGLSEAEFPFVAPLKDTDARSIEAMVSSKNGLPPNNPYISGSGDHVNSTHFAEAARQAVCLVSGDPDILITGGEMTLGRYVELGTPFRLNIAEQGQRDITFGLEQLDKLCAEISLRW